MNSMLARALNSIERGAPAFPLRAPENAPAIKSAHPQGDPLRGKCRGECGRDGHGFHDATTDPATITRWWTTYPDANIGARTGVAFDVLDIDHDDFATGVADLPDCETDGGPVVRTGSGRFHIYFKPSGLGRRIKFSEHCDWLGTDGYVVVPPSTHRAGGRYEWFAPPDLALTAAPSELLDAVARTKATASVLRNPVPFWQRVLLPGGLRSWSPSGLVAQVATAGEGERNTKLHWAAIRVGYAEYERKASASEAATALTDLALAARRAGLGDNEIKNTIMSGYNTGRSGTAPKRNAA